MSATSFRDPDGFVLITDGAVYRVVQQAAALDFLSFLESSAGQALIQTGSFIGGRLARPAERRKVLDSVESRVRGWTEPSVLQHDAVPFPTYPYEWSRGMLREAARTTLEVAQGLLATGRGLKDATPYNILFRGPRPVLVDALSIEHREPGDAVWRPLAQFLQTFLYPLQLDAWQNMPVHDTLRGRREGVRVEEAHAWLNWRNRMRAQGLQWITLPMLLDRQSSGAASAAHGSKRHEPDFARHQLKHLFQRLERALEAIPVAESKTDWSDYSTACHYEAESRRQKREFVEGVLNRLPPGRILDLGCNDGEYSRLAARRHQVVSADLDPVAVDRLWRQATQENLDITPLVMNIANPTPAFGWRNGENPSFLDRAAGHFDGVLMLALLHHLTVTERVPTLMVLDLAADLTREVVVVEWVSPEDPMYQRLLRGRDSLHTGDTKEAFEAACQNRFSIRQRKPLLGGRRWIYELEKRA